MASFNVIPSVSISPGEQSYGPYGGDGSLDGATAVQLSVISLTTPVAIAIDRYEGGDFQETLQLVGQTSGQGIFSCGIDGEGAAIFPAATTLIVRVANTGSLPGVAAVTMQCSRPAAG